MHWIDIAIIAVLIALALFGWQTGFIRKAVLLLSAVGGVALAGAYHEQVIIDLAIADEPTPEMRFASFLAIAAVVVIVGGVAGALLRGTAQVLMLGWADRSAGFIFGLVAGVLLVEAVIAVAVYAPLGGAQELVGQSEIGSLMMNSLPVVRALLPESFDLAIHNFLEGLTEASGSLGL